MLDPELHAFTEAGDGAQAELELASLVEGRVAPLVRTIVTRKLGGFGSNRRFRPEDVEDVIADTMVVLVSRLRRVRDDPGGGAIERLDDYTAAVAYSTCARHLRQRYPERARLKNRLRYLLEHDARFCLWDVQDAGLHCGRSEWRGTAADSQARERFAAIERARERWPASWTSSWRDGEALPQILEDVFVRAGGPIRFDELTGLVAAIWQLDRGEAAPAGNEVDRLADTRLGAEEALDQRRVAAKLWAEIQALPVRQRAALLLNLRDRQGAGLLWILPVTGVASIRAIAGALEMPARDLAAVWNRLPMDDHAIAARLGCSRQQVINLRMSARKRLSNRLGNLGGGPASRIDR